MAASESNQQEQTLVPYESAKDCSQGFCSFYCPQWCYPVFPPPSPFPFVDDNDDSSGSTAFSPLVIAIIGILASAFLLVSYYTIISKYCGGFRRRRRSPLAADDTDDGDSGNQSHRHETWHGSPSSGLDEALIGRISVYRYKRGEGVVDGSDCSVCLSEFREDESLRLLPKCSHAFHLQCIDTWLRSHSNCPLCRANIIVSVNPAPLPPPPPLPLSETSQPVSEGERNEVTVVVMIEDLEEEINSESDGDGLKEPAEDHQGENRHDVIEVHDEEDVQELRQFSMDSARRGRILIADILQESMEDELMMAKDQGLLRGSGSSSRAGGQSSKGCGSRGRSLHPVMSPVAAMKRSASSGRFGLNRHEIGRDSALPV